jgi:hypothetical protein
MVEMPDTRFSDRDVETLLAGGIPEDEGLALLAPVLAKLSDDLTRPPSEERVGSFAAAAVALAAAGKGIEESPTTTRRSRRPRLARRFAIPLAAVFSLSAMTGIALASDDATPGDTLYGVDLALENVGVGAGGAAERLAEASKLAENGNPAAALAHAAQAVAAGVEDDADALEALEGLENSIAELEQPLPDNEATEHAAMVRARVAAMLRWMLDNSELIGSESEPGAFGRGVAEQARQFPADPNDPADTDNGGGPPDGVNPGGPPPSRPNP